MNSDEKREFYKGLKERIKQLRMEHLFEEPCPLYEPEEDENVQYSTIHQTYYGKFMGNRYPVSYVGGSSYYWYGSSS